MATWHKAPKAMTIYSFMAVDDVEDFRRRGVIRFTVMVSSILCSQALSSHYGSEFLSPRLFGLKLENLSCHASEMRQKLGETET